MLADIGGLGIVILVAVVLAALAIVFLISQPKTRWVRRTARPRPRSSGACFCSLRGWDSNPQRTEFGALRESPRRLRGELNCQNQVQSHATDESDRPGEFLQEW